MQVEMKKLIIEDFSTTLNNLKLFDISLLMEKGGERKR